VYRGADFLGSVVGFHMNGIVGLADLLDAVDVIEESGKDVYEFALYAHDNNDQAAKRRIVFYSDYLKNTGQWISPERMALEDKNRAVEVD
jgi:hypothetical protein